MAAFATLICQINSVFLCKGTKLKNSAKPNSRTVCRFSPWNVFPPMKPAVWGFGLGLLGGQGFIGAKASLDPLCRAFVAQSFAFASGNSCFTNSRVQKLQNSAFAEFWDCTPVSCFTNALCQNPRIRRSRILGLFAGFRFCVWKLLFYQQPCAKAPEFGASRILGLYAGSRL